MSQNATRPSRPLRKDGVTLRRSGGEILLYDAAEDRVHVINPPAAAIWDLCDGRTEPDEMVVAICQLTGMPEEVVDEDVARLLGGLDDAHLIVWNDDPE